MSSEVEFVSGIPDRITNKMQSEIDSRTARIEDLRKRREALTASRLALAEPGQAELADPAVIAIKAAPKSRLESLAATRIPRYPSAFRPPDPSPERVVRKTTADLGAGWNTSSRAFSAGRNHGNHPKARLKDQAKHVPR